MLFDKLLELAARLREEGQEGEDEHLQVSPGDLRERWRRRGLHAFEADRDDAAA